MKRKLEIPKNYFIKYIFIFLTVLFIGLLIALLILNKIEKLEIQVTTERFESDNIAQELQRSSNDLTKMVRLYVVTKNPKYLNYFKEILTIRNGESPRPLNYDEIYWDLVTDTSRPSPYGKEKSLKDIMIEHGFSSHEFALLTLASERSTDLVAMEEKAINAMSGIFQDSEGHYTIHGAPDQELAEKLVFGQAYMDQKAIIMEPIREFFESVHNRTTAKQKKLEKNTHSIIILAIIFSSIASAVLIFSVIKTLLLFYRINQTNEQLLSNIFPPSIAARLKKGEESITDESQASIFFADIVKFTSLTEEWGVIKTVDILGKLFEMFDNLTELYDVEKVKTIGDSYMVVSGIPLPSSDHAIKLANFALDARDHMKKFNETNNLNLEIRIGMTSGTVIAGVIGHKKFTYDLWGDVVNVASRMESTGIPGEIQISEIMAKMLEEKFITQERAIIKIKGKGNMKTYLLLGKK